MATFDIAVAAAIVGFLDDQGVDEEEIPRQIPHRRDALAVLSERQFVQRFRLNKDATREVVEAVSSDLSRKRKSRSVFTPEMQVLMALRFFGTGGFLDTIAKDELFNTSKWSVGKAIHAVAKSITQRLTYKVSFPQTVEEKNQIKRAFHKVAGMPGCLGMIDGTEIAIISPATFNDERGVSHFNEANYYTRKGYHALNMLIVCDHNKKIRFLDATNPGANHDAHVWRQSALKVGAAIAFNHGEWLLGDSGYPLESCLMTPVRNPPEGSPSEAYNKAHKKTRVFVEQCIGILKSRFRCLQRYRTLHFQPDKCTAIISACAILHNMCLERNVEVVEEEHTADFEPDDADDAQVPQQVRSIDQEENVAAQDVRQQLINSFQ